MTLFYSIDEDKKLVYVTLPKEATLVDDLETIRQLVTDERLKDGFGILVGVRAASFVPTAREARVMAEAISNSKALLRHPIAVVVSQLIHYGMANMISIIAGLHGATTQAFYEIEEAEAWLRTDGKQA